MRVQVSEIVPDLMRGDRGPLPEAGARPKICLFPQGVVACPLRVPEQLQDADKLDGSIDHRGAREEEFSPSPAGFRRRDALANQRSSRNAPHRR